MKTDTRVQVQGNIRLGQALNLIREYPPEQIKGGKPIFRPEPPPGVLPQQVPYDVPSSNGVEARQSVLRLEKGEETIAIRDDGLCQSYGIFGKPGCGKTFLLKQILEQMLRHPSRPGGLILDPKAALLGEILEVMRSAGRESDLVTISDVPSSGGGTTSLDVLDSPFSAPSLGKALGLALKGAGITATDPYWNNQVSAILGATIELFDVLAVREGRRATLSEIAQALLNSVELDGAEQPLLKSVLADATRVVKEKGASNPINTARSCLANYLQSKDYGTIWSFLHQGFSDFIRPEMQIFSQHRIRPPDAPCLYDSTFEEGKVIVVSVSKELLSISRILCNVVKSLYIQSVLTRLARYNAGKIHDFKRPLFFFVDEYSDVASDGGELGDSTFFSQMRQFGCMGLIATQSIDMLESSSLEKKWRTVFDNLVAKVFFSLADSKTAKEAVELSGESEFRVRAFDRSFSKEGVSISTRFELKKESMLFSDVFLRGLGRGEAVVIGSLDGREQPAVRFFRAGG